MRKKIFVLIGLMVIMLLGVSYAWFNFNQTGENQKLITGDLYLVLEEATDEITINNVYPMSKEKARARNDNYITFTVSGKNTSTDNIYYEIRLKNGNDEAGMTRFNPKDLVFDLIEIDNNEETYLLDAVSYDDLNNRKIWIDTVLKGTNNEVVKTYKLRMWLSNRVIVSDTDPNRDYTAHSGSNDLDKHYASIKVEVYGDIKEKSLPSSTVTRDSFVENGKSYFLTNLTNDYLLEEEGELLDENDVVTLEITNPDEKLYFSYVDSKGNENKSQNESLTLTYTYNRNETVNIKVFTESKNDSNVETTLHFKVTKNGNIVQEYNKEIFVIGNNYCLNNGFTRLSDCILVTENLSNNVGSAKAYIASKGSPNVNETAPVYNYVEDIRGNATYSSGSYGYITWSSGENYVFNSSTGTFTLKRSDGVTDASSYVYLSDDLIGKYTCGIVNNSYHDCNNIYKVTSVDTVNNSIIGIKLGSQTLASIDSQIGLYKVIDNDGDSYIYRGNVINNNVLFGGYYWKILRINGDGSIRLIFNGNTLASNGNKTAGNAAAISTTSETGSGGTYQFNQTVSGPTYVGYMTTENENYWEASTMAVYDVFLEDTAYYFADDFEIYTDTYGNRQFKLKKNTFLEQKKLKELTAEEIALNLYACTGVYNNPEIICPGLMRIDRRLSNVSVYGYYISYSPNYEINPALTKADVELNVRDSNAKRQVDLWYQNKFMNKTNNGKLVTTYLSDSSFCNNRNITRTGNYNSGYLLTTSTFYASRTGLVDAAVPNKSATLLCSKNDSFSVTETSKRNGKLTYPIGLITADEVALAGGMYNARNVDFYLRTNEYFWTMTPAYYQSSRAAALEFRVYPNGMLYWNFSMRDNNGLRPVINLKYDTMISGGDGTVTNPYIID